MPGSLLSYNLWLPVSQNKFYNSFLCFFLFVAHLVTRIVCVVVVVVAIPFLVVVVAAVT